jgi:hypothetical protein
MGEGEPEADEGTLVVTGLMIGACFFGFGGTAGATARGSRGMGTLPDASVEEIN